MYQHLRMDTGNDKSCLPQFLQASWRFTLATTIVFTAVSQTNLAQATKVREDIFASSDLDSNVTKNDIYTSEDIYEVGISKPKQNLICASSQSDESQRILENHQNNRLTERLRAVRTSRELVSRLHSTRQDVSLVPSNSFSVGGEALIIPSTFVGNSVKGLGSTSLNVNTSSHLKSAILLSQLKKEQNSFVPKHVADVSPSSTDSQTTNALDSSPEEVEKILNQLRAVKETEIQPFFYSPSLSVYIPTGFGGDRNRGFVSASYQPRGRFSDDDDFGLGFGVGLGDARKSVGVELSYTLASFGRNRDFGSGGFNVKVHRQLPGDLGVALGWNGFLNIGDSNNFEQSLYGVVTKIIRTQDNIDKPFSRVALTVGIGTGQFRTEDAVFDRDYNVNVFGNVALRVAKPASVIVEWTGQDLGVGVSVAPFPKLPFVITPAVRDITGGGDGARFVIGTGFSFQF